MTEHPTPPSKRETSPPSATRTAASDWAAVRGDKWRAHVAGMEATLGPVDEPVIDALRLDAPCRVADIGCGGGGTSLEIFHRAPAGSVIHGFDISPALIELARERARTNERAIAFDVADMATAPAPVEPYDRLISRFGIMFFDDPAAAFSNLARWLAPGGLFAFAVWGPLADNPWMTIVRDVVAASVHIPPADPDAPSPFRYAEVDKLVALLDRAGFGAIEAHDFRAALPIGGRLSPEGAASFALSSFSSFGELLANGGERAFGDARLALTERFSRHHQDGAVRLDARVHIITGARRSSAT